MDMGPTISMINGKCNPPFGNFSCPISQEAGHKEGGMKGVIEDFAFGILVSFP